MIPQMMMLLRRIGVMRDAPARPEARKHPSSLPAPTRSGMTSVKAASWAGTARPAGERKGEQAIAVMPAHDVEMPPAAAPGLPPVDPVEEPVQELAATGTGTGAGEPPVRKKRAPRKRGSVGVTGGRKSATDNLS